MSAQTGTKDITEVGKVVQQMIDSAPYTFPEIHVHFNDGMWFVTRDRGEPSETK